VARDDIRPDQWKEPARKRLTGWKERLDCGGGAKLAYAAIASSAFMPVVEAARTSPLAAGTALGGALGGSGSSPFANNPRCWGLRW